MNSKEEILKAEYSKLIANPDKIYLQNPSIIKAAHTAMDEYAKPYMEIADLISRIFYYGDFKPETFNEKILERKLIDVGLWPTTEEEIIKRKPIDP
jgi:hypothetical protein